MNRTAEISDLTTKGQAEDVARLAGRGTIYITGAKLWFLATGAGIHFILPRLISKEEFGLYNIVVSTVSIINAVIITGTYQTVSKHVSQEPQTADAVKRNALRMQVLVGGGISLGFFLLAPVISDYLNDRTLVNYLRLASLITLSYSFYAVFTGYFNGRKQFHTQASLDATYSTLKLILVVGLVSLGYGAMGGIAGFAAAAAGILMISALLAGKGSAEGRMRPWGMLGFQANLLAFTLVLNLLQKIDLLLIKALSSADPATANENAGSYSAAINLANITYQVVISATFVIFPLLSEVTFSNDRERTRLYVATTLRYVLMVMAPVAALFSANAPEVIRVIYPEKYLAAAEPLGVIAFGMLFFGLLHVLTTMISASGHPGISLSIGAATLAVSALLNATLIPRYSLVGAAAATTIAMAAGVACSAGYLIAKYRAWISPASALRILACAALVYALSRVVSPVSSAPAIGEMIVLGLIYLAGLVLLKEIEKSDLKHLKRIFGVSARR